MSLKQSTIAALTDADLTFQEDVPLAKRVFWRVGGPADALVRLSTLDQLIALQRIAAECDEPVLILGKGSNLLVSDAGIRGLVVQLTGELAGATASEHTPPQVCFGAGMPLVVALSRARKNRWTGLSCFAGIPGTIGGAVRMNAGSTMGETAVPLLHVDVVCRGGERRQIAFAALKMHYRSTELPEDAIVATATFQTTGADAEAEHTAIRAFLDHRKATQPLHLPSCGSTFRNPEGDYAGRLIDACGLKGVAIGGAQVSEKHANFVVNTGGGTAEDIRAIIEHIQERVQREQGVSLRREVHFVGDWGDR